jgi:hypothetical protein
MATSEDLDVATREDFFMAMDRCRLFKTLAAGGMNRLQLP